MTYYDSAALYIECATTIKEKIVKIDEVITALETNALKAAANDNISEYSLNDGQTTIKTVYRGASEVMDSIMKFEKLKQYYINKLNGRVFRLVDSKSIR